MIARVWHGYTTTVNAEAYENLLVTQVIPAIESEHECTVTVLRQQHLTEVEFVTICYFENLDKIRAFAGDDCERCVVPLEARALLVRFDERSQHYTVRRDGAPSK